MRAIHLNRTCLLLLIPAAPLLAGACTRTSGGDAFAGPGGTSQGDTGATDGTTTDATDSTSSADHTGTTESSADTGSSTGQDQTLAYLEVTPRDTVFELDLNTPASQAFTVTGIYTDGSSLDVTDQVVFSLSNPALGTISDHTLDIPGFDTTQIESSIVTAELGGVVGQAQVTVAAYRQTGDQLDFFFVLPTNDPAGPQVKDLTFSTDVKSMDVFVSMDTTATMGPSIANLQASLSDTVMPGIQAAVPDTHFGVGAVEDFPVTPYGIDLCLLTNEPDQPFELFQTVTGALPQVQAAMEALLTADDRPIGCGGDLPEATIEALYQISTGAGLSGPAPTFVAPNHVGVGGVEFRPGSLPVIVSVTDTASHDPGNPLCSAPFDTDYDSDPSVMAVAHTRQETHAALGEICARVVTIAVNNHNPDCGPYHDGLDFAEQTRAVIPRSAWDLAPGGRPAGCSPAQCCTGLAGAGVPRNADGVCPLVYRADEFGEGVGSGMVDGVSMLARYAPFRVTTERTGATADIHGTPLPAPHTSADFIKAVTPASHGVPPLPGVDDPTMTSTAFENVIPDTDVTFSIQGYNDFVPQTDAPQLFEATIQVLADDCSELDERSVFILVPPAPLPPPV